MNQYKSLNQFFKDIYMNENDPFDEDHLLTYYIDMENKFVYEEKMLKRYKGSLQKYGLTHGGSFESSWGYPSNFEVHEEELKQLENNSNYRILNKEYMGQFLHRKIIGKEKPNGTFVPAKRKDYIWNKV